MLLVVIARLLALFAMVGNGLHAQQAPPTTPSPITVILDSHAITVGLVDVPSPISVTNQLGQSGLAPWMQIGNGYRLLVMQFNAENIEKGIIDELKFKLQIEAREYKNLDDTVGEPRVLIGEVTYLNVPAKQGGTKSCGVFLSSSIDSRPIFGRGK